MTYKEKKAWLTRYAEAEREIDRITENIQRWASRREKMGGSIIPLPVGGGDGDGSVLERATEKITAMQDGLLAKIDEQEAIKAEIEASIGTLENQNQRQVLRYRYLSRMKFENIAVTMTLDYRWVIRLHRSGLEELAPKSP